MNGSTGKIPTISTISGGGGPSPISHSFHDPSCYYEDDQLLIRQYQMGDDIAIQNIFRSSNAGMASAVYQHFSTSPIFGVITLIVTLFVHGFVTYVMDKLFPLLQQQSVESSVVVWLPWCGYLPITATTIAAWTASLLTVILCVQTLHKSINQTARNFVDRNIQDDLIRIPSVYFGAKTTNINHEEEEEKTNHTTTTTNTPTVPLQEDTITNNSVNNNNTTNNNNNKTFTNNCGNFLVAIDKATGEIIGCVGGHDRTVDYLQDNNNKNKNNNVDQTSMAMTPAVVVVEVRRMGVNPSFHRRSVAKKLMSTLEQSLVQHASSSTVAAATTTTTTTCLQDSNKNKQHQNSSKEEKKNNDEILLYLTCSNLQAPALRLYQSFGYTMTQTFRPTKAPLWIRYSGILVHRFEKRLPLVVVVSSSHEQQSLSQQLSSS